jgi:SAM-dependent methyltransferase
MFFMSWYKILLVALFIVLGYFSLNNWWKKTEESFESMTDASLSLSRIQGDTKYKLVSSPYTDPYYVNIYDNLYLPHTHLPEEVDWILKTTQATPSTALIVDVGSGTGSAVAALLENGYSNSYGIDASQQMIDKGSQKRPSTAKHCACANVLLEPMLFEKESCTHILCLDKTIYELDDKRTFFRHCYYWLKPGGILALHLVEPDKYNPQPLLSYKNSIFVDKTSRPVDVKFVLPGEVHYKSATDKSSGVMTETFECGDTGHVRQVERKLYMEPPDDIVRLAQKNGFIPTAMKTDQPFLRRVSSDDPHQQIVLLERAL